MKKTVTIDEKSIQSVFHRDCLLLLVFMTAMWSVIIPVLLTVLGLSEDPVVKALLTCAACISGAALSWGMVEVFLHIRRNKKEIYKEDLENLKLSEH